MVNFRPLTAAATLAASLALSACITPPDVAAPPARLSAQDVGLSAAPGTVTSNWWRDFHDPQLDRLMDQAFAHNPSLSQAIARVRAARAMTSVARAGLSPSVSLDAQNARERFSADGEIPPPYAGGDYWFGTDGLNLSWDLDFWGRQSSRLKQAHAQETATAFDAANARLALGSAVAVAYVDLYRHDALADIAARTEAQRTHILTITRRRLEAGLDTNVEVSEADGAVPQARIAREQEQAASDLAIHRLAALTGQGANDYARITRPQLDPAAMLPLPSALPADLLARRPDIVAARHRIDAATAGQAAARADFYPDIDLTAFAATSAIGFGNLFKAASGTYGAGPALHLPLFDAGRLRAQYRGASAEIDAAVDAYNQTVLQAVREAADQLTLIRALGRERAAQATRLNDAETAYRLAEERYRSGLATYLTVLTAETDLLDARRRDIDLIAAQAIARIDLMVAIGGDGRNADIAQTASSLPI